MMNMSPRWRSLAILPLLGSLSACSTLSAVVDVPLGWIGLGGSAEAENPPGIDATGLLQHITALASDEFEGRLPGTRGEELTVAYIESQFRSMGLSSGNPQGGYRQDVALVGLTGQGDVGMTVADQSIPLRLGDDVVFSTARVEPMIRQRNSDIVFVGYGVQAPEYGWDDYKGLDVRGKTLLMLVNDPPVRSQDDPRVLDPAMFKAEAMTYYGRWTYKYDIASKLGAAAVLVIHETRDAGYPWEVVSSHVGGEYFTLDTPNGNADRVPIRGWLRDGKARELMAAANLDFDALKLAAARSDFQPVALPGTASFQLRNSIRRLRSANVAGLVRGTTRPDEVLVFTAHWDHLGRDETRVGDGIYNGAVDNASGVAGLLELAQAFAARPAERSMLFLAVTAEEQGLLGARYYAENPLYPLDRTVANINMDALNTGGRTRDVIVVGWGQSSLENELEAAARNQGRYLRNEPTPEKGFYFRSDHFEFARKGVPALYAARGGVDFVGKPAGYGEALKARYVAEDYHKVSDEVRPDWDLSGMVEDMQLMEAVARRVAVRPTWPQWAPTSEFAHLRNPRHP